MKNKRFILRFFATITALASMTFVWSCIDRPMKVADPQPDVISDFSAVQASTRDVDILFMIDTSKSMELEQETLRRNFANLMLVLKEISGGLPNVHIGVISPDLGAYNYEIGGCDGVGDDGKLLKGAGCANPVGQNFIIDVEPAGCTINRDDDTNLCSADDCSQANCEQAAFTVDGVSTEPAGLTLQVDDDGCPRCRNYTSQSLEDVFQCMADIGTGGCGFEQPLEAVYRSLTANKNPGFIRSNAYLALFLISDEDDCSAKEPGTIFDTQYTGLEDNLGPLNSFRCTEFGIVCDQAWNRIVLGGVENYTNCHSRSATDNNNLLKPISTYVQFIQSVKSSELIIAGAIAGPYNNGNLAVKADEYGWPELDPICGGDEGAVPGVRLYEFVASFISNEDDLSWAYTSICNADYSQALEGLGEKIKALVEVQCITTPLKGCPDPAAANGLTPITSLPSNEASVCEAVCEVKDILADNSITPIYMCPSDYPSGNPGHPEKRDPNLPVDQCWHVRYNDSCAEQANFGPSRGAEIIISRKTNPAPGTSASITCAGFPLTEMLCQDDIDNDFDGLTDCEDPDCQNTDSGPNIICAGK